MLVLRSSGASPFVRKVRIAADIIGLADRIEVVDAETLTPAPDLLEQNPLGKIPTLVLENGDTLYDSRVILEYLDVLGGGALIPQGSRRFAALRLQALADGLMDAAVLQMYEIRWRPEEHRVEKWVAHQKGKVARALDEAERSLDAAPATPIHVGHIALACALGYLDLRFEGKWRNDHPKLVAWLDDFAKTRAGLRGDADVGVGGGAPAKEETLSRGDHKAGSPQATDKSPDRPQRQEGQKRQPADQQHNPELAHGGVPQRKGRPRECRPFGGVRDPSNRYSPQTPKCRLGSGRHPASPPLRKRAVRSGTFVGRQVCVSPGAAYLDGAWKSTLNTCLRLSSVTCMRHPRQSGPSGMKGTVCLTIRMAWRWAASQFASSTPSQSHISSLSCDRKSK